MNITEEHLHHMARRHHATMKKLDGIKERITGVTQRFVSTIESLGGAWIGGALEGRTGGAAIGPLPVNLGVGILLIAGSHLNVATKWSDDLTHLGNGFVGSWAAATGYAFGKRWKDTGKMLGGGGHPWARPYEDGWPHGSPPTP